MHTKFVIELQIPIYCRPGSINRFYFAGKRQGHPLWLDPRTDEGRINMYATKAGAQRAADKLIGRRISVVEATKA